MNSVTAIVDRVIADTAPAETSLDRLETPAALVDLPVMAANLIRTASYCQSHGLGYRPHTKTHKSAALGTAQLLAGAQGLTVATLREAEVMATVCDDLLLAYPPVGAAKLERLIALAERVGGITVALDSPDALVAMNQAAAAAGVEIGVMIELDLGMGRAGVTTPESAVALAKLAAEASHLRYVGIMFYPGHIREPAGQQDAALAAVQRGLDEFRRALEAAGLSPAIVSGGSTPSLWRSHELSGLTEIRPGQSVFNDRTTAVIEACSWQDCAYTVLATVVSTTVKDQAVVDAGSKALAKEEMRGSGGGYGVLLDRPEIPVKSLSEEHGLLDLSQTDWRPKVGDRVRIVPNHVCVSVNLQDQMWGVRDGAVVCRWPVAARGRALFD